MPVIPVTKPFLPPFGEYAELLQGIYERGWLTNNGPLMCDFELQLRSRFDLPYGLVVSNGTIALQLAVKALGLRGRVLTTPFSYVATASSIAWEGCVPTFVDIEEGSFNVDIQELERCITNDVSGIVLTHCFGIPANVYEVDAVAKKHNLPVIYDAAHAFGTTVDGQSIFKFGHVSTCSFHATKIFHCIEGGAVFSNDSAFMDRVAWMRNFGHDGFERFHGVGINGKNSEVHAAMGLVNLRYINDLIHERRLQTMTYNQLLVHKRELRLPNVNLAGWNHSYYPVVFENEQVMRRALTECNENGIFPRRYFYPSLNTINGWEGSCPIADSIASRVLCLPLYSGLSEKEQELISSTLIKSL